MQDSRQLFRFRALAVLDSIATFVVAQNLALLFLVAVINLTEVRLYWQEGLIMWWLLILAVLLTPWGIALGAVGVILGLVESQWGKPAGGLGSRVVLVI